jgi:hypothetical protein
VEKETWRLTGFPALLSCAQSIKNNIGKEKMELLKLVLEPRSQVSLAASNGFFSA